MNFIDQLPVHNTVTLTHNPQKSYYETVAEYEQYRKQRFDSEMEWVSDEERRLAIETNDMWQIQWYPDTPIGSYTLYAHNLDLLLKYARMVSVAGGTLD